MYEYDLTASFKTNIDTPRNGHVLMKMMEKRAPFVAIIFSREDKSRFNAKLM